MLLFYNGEKSQVHIVIDAIKDFCNMSSLHINFEKSRAMASRYLTAWKKESLARFTSI